MAETNNLRERIEAACATTKPETKARNQALAKIKWRLQAANGLCAGLDNKFCCALVQQHNALVFDGRDNETLKKRFYEALLGVKLDVVLLKSATPR